MTFLPKNEMGIPPWPSACLGVSAGQCAPSQTHTFAKAHWISFFFNPWKYPPVACTYFYEVGGNTHSLRHFMKILCKNQVVDQDMSVFVQDGMCLGFIKESCKLRGWPLVKKELPASQSLASASRRSVRHGRQTRLWEKWGGRDRWQKAWREPALVSPSPVYVEEKDKSSAPHIHALDWSQTVNLPFFFFFKEMHLWVQEVEKTWNFFAVQYLVLFFFLKKKDVESGL